MAKRGTLEHEKTLALAERLELDPCCALGVMEAFWQWVARSRPTGDITGIKPAHLAMSILYSRNADHLWNSLIEVGFVDVAASGEVFVHGWSEHADDGVHMAVARKRVFFADGAVPKLTRFCGAEKSELKSYYDAALQSRTADTGKSVRTESAQDAHRKRTSLSLSLSLNPHPNPPPLSERDLAVEVTEDLSEREEGDRQDFTDTPVPNQPPTQTRQAARSAELVERYGFDPQPDIHLHFGQPPNGSFFTSIYERLDYFLDQGTPITAEEFHDTALAVREATRSKYGKLPYTHKPLCDELANVVANRKTPVAVAVNPNDPEHWHDPVPPNAIPSLQREVINFALDGNAAELTAYEALVWQKMRQWKCSDERIQAEIQAARHLAWKAAEKEQLTAALLTMPQFAEYRSAQC